MTPRSTMLFTTLDAFRTAVTAFGNGPWLVPSAEPVSEGQLLTIDVSVDNKLRIELTGQVVKSEQEVDGTTALQVELTKRSRETTDDLMQKLKADETLDAAALAQTLVRSSDVPSVVVSEPGTETVLAPGTLVGDRYRIEAHVATGGMGQVYRATQVNLKRTVALKMLRRVYTTDPAMWMRFQREAELVSQLESPHVVRVFDFGQSASDEPFLAMEWVEGPTLESVVQHGPLSPQRGVKILLDVCEGLAEAHSLGVIHRDLKPANFMLAKRRDGTELAKILDFGIARLSSRAVTPESQKLTQVGIVVGTPAYLAPEQATGDKLDHRTDIYSLGCVAFEVFTGQPPFVATDLHQIVRMQVMTPPADPSSLRPELKAYPALCAAVLKALAKDRTERFQDVRDFARALSAALTAPGDQRVPDAMAPMPPKPNFIASSKSTPGFVETEDWKPARFPTPLPVAPSAKEAVDEFFSSVAGAPASSPALVAFVDCVGVSPGAPAAVSCLGRLADVATRFGAITELRDESSLVIVIPYATQMPAGRLCKLLIALREHAVDEGQRAQPPVGLNIRGGAIVGAIDGIRPPLGARDASKARQFSARAKVGHLVVDAQIASSAGDAFEFAASAEIAGDMILVGRRLRPRRPGGSIIGYASVLEVLDRRLASLASGHAESVVVRGAPGAGRTLIALDLAARAKKRGIVAGVSQPVESLRGQPYGAVTQLLCSVCGISAEARHSKLRAVLEGLKLKPSLVEAVMVVTGVSQLQGAFSAGQVAYAIRKVFEAGAGERPIILVFDELESVDPSSLAVFRELCMHPGPRELTVGFTTQSSTGERVYGVHAVDLPLLGRDDLLKIAAEFLEAPVGQRLLSFLVQQSKGVGGAAVDWLAYLDDRGSLKTSGGAIELVDDVTTLDADALLRERLYLLPLEVQRTLEAGALSDDSFEPQQLTTAWPRATPAALQHAYAARLLRIIGVRRWAFSSTRIHSAVLKCASADRPQMHLRLATALVEKGKIDPLSVDAVTVARHLVAARDGVRAAQIWKHAAEAALARRAHRDAIVALRGYAHAIAISPSSAESTRLRVEALSRAAAMALSAPHVSLARGLMDEAQTLAQQLNPPSIDLLLAFARLLRIEGQHARASEVLDTAATCAQGSAFSALVDAERAESFEQKGDWSQATAAWEAALVMAEGARDISRWHGEVEFQARVEARLAAVCLQRNDLSNARRLFESSLLRWKKVNWPFGEARVLVNLGTTCIQASEFDVAVRQFEAAAAAAARCGDLLFQAKAMLLQVKALKRMDSQSTAAKALASECFKMCQAISWDVGRSEAAALAQ